MIFFSILSDIKKYVVGGNNYVKKKKNFNNYDNISNYGIKLTYLFLLGTKG